MRSVHRRVILAPDNYQIAMDFAEAAEAAGHIKTAVFWAQHATSLTDAPAAHGRTQSLTHKLN
jgi:sulfur relay (sulfurtransferase) complex TusBCD TusD component (DsrE family)